MTYFEWNDQLRSLDREIDQRNAMIATLVLVWRERSWKVQKRFRGEITKELDKIAAAEAKKSELLQLQREGKLTFTDDGVQS
jgi:hypothetical protein